jgi:hypothetical protein
VSVSTGIAGAHHRPQWRMGTPCSAGPQTYGILKCVACLFGPASVLLTADTLLDPCCDIWEEFPEYLFGGGHPIIESWGGEADRSATPLTVFTKVTFCRHVTQYSEE